MAATQELRALQPINMQRSACAEWKKCGSLAVGTEHADVLTSMREKMFLFPALHSLSSLVFQIAATHGQYVNMSAVIYLCALLRIEQQQSTKYGRFCREHKSNQPATQRRKTEGTLGGTKKKGGERWSMRNAYTKRQEHTNKST